MQDPKTSPGAFLSEALEAVIKTYDYNDVARRKEARRMQR